MPAESGPILSLREKIEAEQSGNPIGVSERFERGVSLAASILAHFTEEQAEICLVTGSDAGEFGIGTRHLYKCLQRLAIVEPQYLTKNEPETHDKRILTEPDGVYRFVVAAEGISEPVSEPSQQLKIIRF
jgi:uncharacterized protein (DUF58 family)